MKLSIEPTGELVMHQGAMCRAWLGKDEQGRELLVLVAGVVLPEDQPTDPEWERELMGMGEISLDRFIVTSVQPAAGPAETIDVELQVKGKA